jgi:hypothetical protein
VRSVVICQLGGVLVFTIIIHDPRTESRHNKGKFIEKVNRAGGGGTNLRAFHPPRLNYRSAWASSGHALPPVGVTTFLCWDNKFCGDGAAV